MASVAYFPFILHPKALVGLGLIISCCFFSACGDTSAGPTIRTSAPQTSSSLAASSSAENSSSLASSEETSSSAVSSSSSAQSSTPPLLEATFTDPDTGEGVVLQLSAEETTLAARGATTLSATFLDVYEQPVQQQGTLILSSSCITAKTADAKAITEPPNTPAHIAQFSYQAKTGCAGKDIVTFSGFWNGATYSGTLGLDISTEPLSNIQWLNTEPSQISIRGLGSQETAIITFALRGYNGENIEGEEILFSLEGATGGVNLINDRAISDAAGQVRAQVRAGTAPTNVTVLATHAPTGETAPSSNLIVASGMAIEGSVKLATNVINLLGRNRIGSQSATITVAATDRSGNPVPDSTSVNFVSEEGGNITPTCALKNGLCTATFAPNGKEPSDGRVQIFAFIKGSEGFIDKNGNKIFDDGDTFDPAIHEKGEPYSDNNNNGEYDEGEHFTDTNNDGIRTPGNELWDGTNCQHSNLCSPTKNLIDLGTQLTLILSDGRYPTLCSLGEFSGASYSVTPKGSLVLSGLYLSDGNNSADNPLDYPCTQGNPLPVGTTIEFSATNGKLAGTASWSIGNTTLPTGPYNLRYTAPSEAGIDVITLKITTPETIASYNWNINVEAP